MSDVIKGKLSSTQSMSGVLNSDQIIAGKLGAEKIYLEYTGGLSDTIAVKIDRQNVIRAELVGDALINQQFVNYGKLQDLKDVEKETARKNIDAVRSSGAELTPGTFTKFSVNKNGLIVSTDTLTADDIPSNLNSTTINGTLKVLGDVINIGSVVETRTSEIYTQDNFMYLRDGANKSLKDGEFSGILTLDYDGYNSGGIVISNTGELRIGDVNILYNEVDRPSLRDNCNGLYCFDGTRYFLINPDTPLEKIVGEKLYDRVLETRDTQPVLTRDELTGMNNNSLLYWDSIDLRAKTNSKVKILNDRVHSNGSEVVNLADDQTITGNKIFNGTVDALNNVTIGSNEDSVLTLASKVRGSILPVVDVENDLGSASNRYKSLHARNIYATTDSTDSKLFITGTTNLTDGMMKANSSVYMQNGKIFSNNSESVNLADNQTITGSKTFNSATFKADVIVDKAGNNEASIKFKTNNSERGMISYSPIDSMLNIYSSSTDTMLGITDLEKDGHGQVVGGGELVFGKRGQEKYKVYHSGNIDISEYIKFADYATVDDIDSKTTEFKYLSPKYLDYAIMSGLTNPTNITWTSEQKIDAADTLNVLSRKFAPDVNKNYAYIYGKDGANDVEISHTADSGTIIIRDEFGRAKIQNPTDNADIANKIYVDTQVATKVDSEYVQEQLENYVTLATTQTISGQKTFTNNVYIGSDDDPKDLYVSGNVYQQGTSYITEAEHLKIKDSIIHTRAEASNALGDDEYTGLVAENYDGQYSGALVYDKHGVARIGDVTFTDGELEIVDTQPIVTRDEIENTVDGGVVYWDKTSWKIKTLNNDVDSGYILVNTEHGVPQWIDPQTIHSGISNELVHNITFDSGIGLTDTFNGTSDKTLVGKYVDMFNDQIIVGRKTFAYNPVFDGVYIDGFNLAVPNIDKDEVIATVSNIQTLEDSLASRTKLDNQTVSLNSNNEIQAIGLTDEEVYLSFENVYDSMMITILGEDE